MRRVIESTLVSLDGVTEAPGAWTGDYFDSEAHSWPSNSSRPVTRC